MHHYRLRTIFLRLFSLFVCFSCFCVYAEALKCFECFHTPLDDSISADPEATTALPPPPSCPRSSNCTVDGGVCIYSENRREKHFDAYCLRDTVSDVDDGCWTDSKNGDVTLCFCSTEFCNEVLGEYGKLPARFGKLDANPFVGNLSAATADAGGGGGETNERERRRKAQSERINAAIRENAAFTDDIDVVPVNLSDYEEFLLGRNSGLGDNGATAMPRLSPIAILAAAAVVVWPQIASRIMARRLFH